MGRTHTATKVQINLISDVERLDHAGKSYMLGAILATHIGEPDNSGFWLFVGKLVELQRGKPKPPASAKP